MGRGSRWLRARSFCGRSQHSCWAEPPASLMGVNNCRGFAGGDQRRDHKRGPSLGGTVHFRPSAAGRLSAPGQRPSSSATVMHTIVLSLCKFRNVSLTVSYRNYLQLLGLWD